MEAVLPVELELESLRVALESEVPEAEWRKQRFEELVLCDEKRMKALYHFFGYQRRVIDAFNKRVKGSW